MLTKFQIAMQILGGIVCIIILYIITLVVLNVDAIVETSNTTVKPKEFVRIVDGFTSIISLTNKSFNTVTPLAGTNFRKIGKSINTAGGAQFSYQFWMKVGEANDTLFKDLVILLKGDKRPFNIGYYKELSNNTYKLVNTQDNEHVIACPMIKFGKSYREFVIRINTTKAPVVDIPITMNTNSVGRQNLLSLLAINSWYLLTFVFKDNFNVPSSAEDGIQFHLYVNDIPYIEYGASSLPVLKGNALRQNEGDLTLFPNNATSNDFLKLGNIGYYNYALNAKQIQKVFEQGPPNHVANVNGDKKEQPSFISAYNKIDIFNY